MLVPMRPVASFLTAFVLAVAATGGSPAPVAAAPAAAPTIRVQGRQLVDGAGRPVQLRGVNRAAFESRCTYDANGFADGPVDQASVDAMLAWKINVVRLTLNEDCWLGVNGLPLGGDAAGYRAAVRAYVALLRRNGLYVMPVVEEFGPGTQRSTQIDYLPDRDHMPAFWRSVATAFKADHGIVFDPVTEVGIAEWNDPHPQPPGQWACWLHGCTRRLGLRQGAPLRLGRHPVARDDHPLDRRHPADRPRRHRLQRRPRPAARLPAAPIRRTSWSRPPTSTTSSRARTS